VHLKFFSCLLGLTVLVEGTAVVLIYKHKSNYLLYNLFMLVEFSSYAFFYLLSIHKGKMKRLMQASLLIFPIIWTILMARGGLKEWNGTLITVGSFFSVLFALNYYHYIITAPQLLSLRTLPEFWIATGMLIFYLGSFAFFGMLNFILKYQEVAAKLLDVFEVLNIIMYALFSYAFLCRTSNTMRS